MVFQVDFRIDFKCFESGEVLEVYSTVIFEGTRPRQSLLPSIKKSVLYTQKIRYPILLGSDGLEVAHSGRPKPCEEIWVDDKII